MVNVNTTRPNSLDGANSLDTADTPTDTLLSYKIETSTLRYIIYYSSDYSCRINKVVVGTENVCGA